MPIRKKTAAVPPPPPTDLATRCRATIPVAAKSPLFTTRHRALMIGAALSLAVATLELTRSSRIPHSPVPNSGAAFAETIHAMQRVTFYHMRETGVSVTWGSLTSHYTGDWWFDAERGYCDDDYYEEPVQDYHYLFLPDGKRYYRYKKRVRIFSDGPASWQKTRRGNLRRLTDLSRLGSGLYVSKSLTPKDTHTALWGKRPATRFTFVVPPITPSGETPLKDAPTIRSEVYVDPDSRRVIAVQKYARFASHPEVGEVFTSQEEYNYTQRPDRAHFDPHPFLRGATWVRHASGTDDPVNHPEPDETGP